MELAPVNALLDLWPGFESLEWLYPFGVYGCVADYFAFTQHKFFEVRKSTEFDDSIMDPRIIGLTMISLGIVFMMLATFEYRGRSWF